MLNHMPVIIQGNAWVAQSLVLRHRDLYSKRKLNPVSPLSLLLGRQGYKLWTLLHCCQAASILSGETS